MPDSPLLLQNKPIVLGALETHLRPFLSEKAAGRAVFVVADENTIGILPSFLADHPRAVLPPGEQHKTLAQCEQVWTQMLAASLDRNALVLNFGGGVIGDLGGFCAAAYKRGIDFIQIPTTLLAMTDAAIGGKTGIDLGGLKNVVGAFRQPEAVFVDPALLATLPERELRSGLAEVYKHAFIADPDLLERIRGIEPGAYQQVDWLAVLRQSIRVKVQVVAQDPLERGLRALLNFGHTIGHAVESYFLQSSSPLTHGEAIAVGMVAEMAIQNPDHARELALELRAHFPFVSIPEEAYPDLWQWMLNDKKNQGSTVTMALPGEQPYTLQKIAITREDLRRGLDFYQNQ